MERTRNSSSMAASDIPADFKSFLITSSGSFSICAPITPTPFKILKIIININHYSFTEYMYSYLEWAATLVLHQTVIQKNQALWWQQVTRVCQWHRNKEQIASRISNLKQLTLSMMTQTWPNKCSGIEWHLRTSCKTCIEKENNQEPMLWKNGHFTIELSLTDILI